jgi:hypothetical protein
MQLLMFVFLIIMHKQESISWKYDKKCSHFANILVSLCNTFNPAII